MRQVDLLDLLDSLDEQQVDLSQDVPLSQARIKELTMKNINPKGKRTVRFTSRLLIAAAVAAVMSVTAIAAGYILGAGTLFQDFFTSQGEPLSGSQVDQLNEIGQTFEGGVTSNGATITPVAALADENIYYLRLRVDAPEGVVLPDRGDDETGYYQVFGPDASMDLDLSACEDGGFVSSLQCLPDADPEDGEKEFVLRFEAQPGSGLKFNDGITKPLTIHGLWVQGSDKEYSQVFGGEFVFDIGLHFESRVLQIPCEGLQWHSEAYHYTSTLEEMTISPLSLYVKYHADQPDDPSIGTAPGPISVLLRDGTVLSRESMNQGPGGGDGNDFEEVYVFAAPLDLNEVECIQFGEHQIRLPEAS